MFIARNPIAFVTTYLLLAVPTYILPYFGSNSMIVNAFGAVLGKGPTPQWWMHIWFLTMLVILGWMRGRVTAKGYLAAFPVLAGIFDMTPGLSMIPAIPTLMHLICIIVGAMGKERDAQDGEAAPTPALGVGRKAVIAATLMTVAAVSGSTLFMITAACAAKEWQHQFERPAEKRAAQPVKAEVPTAKAPETPPALVPVAPGFNPDTTAVAPEPPAISKMPQHKAVHVARKPVPPAHTAQAPRAPETKSAPPQKPEVRYIRIND